MCIYIYNPEQKLSLEHVSETLVPEKGTYEIVLDIVLKNCSGKNLTKIFAIVPHALFGVEYNEYTQKNELIDTGTFEDISYEFRDKNLPRNSIYLVYPNDLTVTLKNNVEHVTITQANPKYPSKNQQFDGILLGGNKLKGIDNLTIEDYAILSKNRISILSCDINPVLKPKESGVFRWKIIPKSTSLNRQNALLLIFNWLRNNIIYRYKIIGPDSVKKRVKTKLLSYQRSSCHSNNVNDLKLITVVNNLITGILYNHIRRGNTIVKDWRINLYPKRFRTVSITSTEGNIKPCGSLPNHLDTETYDYKYDLVYQWYSFCKDANSSDINNNGFKEDFSIHFSVQFINIIYQFIVWICLVLAILKFIL